MRQYWRYGLGPKGKRLVGQELINSSRTDTKCSTTRRAIPPRASRSRLLRDVISFGEEPSKCHVAGKNFALEVVTTSPMKLLLGIPTSSRASRHRHPPGTVAAAIVVLSALFSAGCQNTPAFRIHQNLTLYHSLDLECQELIRQGLVSYGFSAAMVHMALGKPSRTASSIHAQGLVQTWTYRNFLYATPQAAMLTVIPAGSSPVPIALMGSAGTAAGNSGTRPFQLSLDDGTNMPLGTLILELYEDRVVTI